MAARRVNQREQARQKAFINAYLSGKNGSESAILAGYSKNGAKVRAHELLKNPAVRAEIDRRSKEITDKVGIDAAWVLTKLVELHNNCCTPGKDFDPHATARALESIGKHKAVRAFEEEKKSNTLIIGGAISLSLQQFIVKTIAASKPANLAPENNSKKVLIA